MFGYSTSARLFIVAIVFTQNHCGFTMVIFFISYFIIINCLFPMRNFFFQLCIRLLDSRIITKRSWRGPTEPNPISFAFVLPIFQSLAQIAKLNFVLPMKTCEEMRSWERTCDVCLNALVCINVYSFLRSGFYKTGLLSAGWLGETVLFFK